MARHWAALVLTAWLGLGGGVCAAAETTRGPAAAPLRPLVVGWERYFTVEWKTSEVRGRPVVWGYVENAWGTPAIRVQLLVESLDQAGQVVAQRVEWLPDRTLMPGERAYFEVPAPRPAAQYRVSVFAFDWLQEDGRVRRRF